MSTDDDVVCLNCGRDGSMVALTKHHVVPKARGGSGGVLMVLCDDCHGFLNTQYTVCEQEMLATPEGVVTDERMARFGKFAAKQSSRVTLRDSASRNRKRRYGRS